jgi:hypothetical protein
MRNGIKTRTDAKGQFSLAHVTPGQFQFKAAAPGYRPFEQSLELPAQGLDVTVALVAAGRSLLRGRVVDETGKPIPGVDVRWVGEPLASHGEDVLARTDDEGLFAWSEAPEGSARLSFSAPSFESEEVELASGSTEHLITLAPARTAEVHCGVTDKATGLPIPRFKVQVGTRDETWRTARVDLVKFVGEGADGHFVFRLPPDELRVQGPWSVPVVRIEANGYEPEIVAVTNTASGALDVNVQLQRVEGFIAPR